MRYPLLITLFLLLPTYAWADKDFVWVPSPDSDVSHYNLYVCAAGISPCLAGGASIFTDQFLDINCDRANNTCVWVEGVPLNTEGTASLTGVDLSGNESLESNTVPFNRRGPSPPTGLRVQ